MPGPVVGEKTLPLAGLSHEVLDQLSEALERGPIDGAILRFLLENDFYKTELAKPGARSLVEWLVEQALPALLPEAVTKREFGAWRELLVHALILSPQLCVEECEDLRPELSKAASASSPFLKAFREAFVRMRNGSQGGGGRTGWFAPLARVDGPEDGSVGELLMHVARNASIDTKARIVPVGDYSSVKNSLVSLLYASGLLNPWGAVGTAIDSCVAGPPGEPGLPTGKRDVATRGALTVSTSATNGSGRREALAPALSGISNLRPKAIAGALTPHGVFASQLPAPSGRLLPGAYAGEALGGTDVETGLLTGESTTTPPAIWWSTYMPVLAQLGTTLLRYPKTLAATVAALCVAGLVRQQLSSDETGGHHLDEVDANVRGILGAERWGKIEALALMSSPPADAIDQVMAVMADVSDELCDAIGELSRDEAVPMMDLFQFDAPLSDLNLAMWLLAMALRDAPEAGPVASIPYSNFTLPNGLNVVVHEDRKAPIVAVQVWYNVGSANEPAGSTGVAHLFEHLFFLGSANHPGEYSKPFIEVGAAANAMTTRDSTAFVQTVPTTALNMALWMESDRMKSLLPIDQERLDNERGVVRNEKLETDSSFARANSALAQALYPQDHPYRHAIIGSMDDLNAATPEDMNQWFRARYGPNNAVVVLSGDIDLATAREQVTRYFSDIAPGPVHAALQPPVVARAQATRETLNDQVSRPMMLRAWPVPKSSDPALPQLDLFARVLQHRLDGMRTEGLVDYVMSYTRGRALGSEFVVHASIPPGVDTGRVQTRIDEHIERLKQQGPTADELGRIVTSLQTELASAYESVAVKANALGRCAVAKGTPGCFADRMQVIGEATPQSVSQAGQAWLGAGDHTVLQMPGVRPSTTSDVRISTNRSSVPDSTSRNGAQGFVYDLNLRTTGTGVDRSQGVPIPTDFPEVRFPYLQRAILSNGMKVILAQRRGAPLTRMDIQFDACGHARDTAGKEGISRFTAAMLTEGAGNDNKEALRSRADALGADINANANLDGCSVELKVVQGELDPALTLLASIVSEPRFEDVAIEAMRQGLLSVLADDAVTQEGVISRLLPTLVYGKNHPYASPSRGWGTEESLAAITREDIVDFHRERYRPENATVIVVGDTNMDDLVPLLEQRLGGWRAVGASPVPVALADVVPPTQPTVYLVDHTDTDQVSISAALVLDSGANSTEAFDIANTILGVGLTSRVNEALRGRGWSYGAGSSTRRSNGPGLWELSAPVEIEKASEALAVVHQVISDYATGKSPVTAEEVEAIKKSELRGMPARYEKGGRVLDAIGRNVQLGRPDRFIREYKSRLEAVSVEDVGLAARALNPQRLTWMVVGDLSRIEAPIRNLTLGQVTVLDDQGDPVS